jgi:hypothetical protein
MSSTVPVFTGYHSPNNSRWKKMYREIHPMYASSVRFATCFTRIRFRMRSRSLGGWLALDSDSSARPSLPSPFLPPYLILPSLPFGPIIYSAPSPFWLCKRERGAAGGVRVPGRCIDLSLIEYECELTRLANPLAKELFSEALS